MAFFNSDKPLAPVFGEAMEPTDECFYCLKPLAGDAIFWHGCQMQIWLHPWCAKRLAERLTSDFNEFLRDKFNIP